MKKALPHAALALALALAALASHARVYQVNYLRQGSLLAIAWNNTGGIEFYSGQINVFLCPMNPIAPLFQDIVADC